MTEPVAQDPRRPRRRSPGKRVARAGVDFNVPLDGRRGSPTTRASAPRCRRSARCASAAPRGSSWPATSAGRRAADPSCRCAPVRDRLGELLGTTSRSRRRWPRSRAAVPDAERRRPARERPLRRRARPRTTPSCAARYARAGRRLRRTTPSAPRTARTPPRTPWRSSAAAPRACCCEREVATLTSILADPERPFVAIVGGAKVTDKIGVLEKFLEVADAVLIGGAMCFPFFAAQGHDVGASLCEAEGIEPARRVLDDAATAAAAGRPRAAAASSPPTPSAQDLDGVDVPDGWMGLDVGPQSAAALRRWSSRRAARSSGTAPWARSSWSRSRRGTRAVAEAVAAAPGTTVVGGGDSAAALHAVRAGRTR